jgi:3-oxoacyl-[acyl-carrier protein] reductase
VNNAGIYPFSGFVDAEEEFWRRVMEVNLFAVAWMCRSMIEQRGKKGGVIINLGSIEGVIPFMAEAAHYSVSKAGVIALTRALAKEHAGRGFRVNAVVPGGIVTRGTVSVARQVLQGQFGLIRDGIRFGQRLPARRLGRPDEVARMVLVLASDLASYVHGAAIPVDGGFLTG